MPDPRLAAVVICIAAAIALTVTTILARHADARACDWANTTHQED